MKPSKSRSEAAFARNHHHRVGVSSAFCYKTFYRVCRVRCASVSIILAFISARRVVAAEYDERGLSTFGRPTIAGLIGRRGSRSLSSSSPFFASECARGVFIDFSCGGSPSRQQHVLQQAFCAATVNARRSSRFRKQAVENQPPHDRIQTVILFATRRRSVFTGAQMFNVAHPPASGFPRAHPQAAGSNYRHAEISTPSSVPQSADNVRINSRPSISATALTMRVEPEITASISASAKTLLSNVDFLR